MSGGMDFIPVARPWMGEEEAEAARRAILSGWVTQGPEVKAFEEEFAAYMGAENACAVSSCTTALHLALKAAGVGLGDEVITVSHSFIATANSVRYCGGVPVFVDIQPDTFNMDPTLVEAAISPHTKAILCVHQIGMPCDLQGILSVAQKHGLKVIEDAACATGSGIFLDDRWQKIGAPHSDAACFSFHPRKLLSTGDGGMITTRHAEWDRNFRLWRQHGMSVPDSVRHNASQVIFEEYRELGYNYRMTDIQAAIGRVQLGRLPQVLVQRRLQAERYNRELAGIPGIGLPSEPAWARSNWQSYCLRLPRGVKQVEVMQKMFDAGIATRRGVMCAHREPAYRGKNWRCKDGPGECGCTPGTCKNLAQSEAAQDGCIILPLFHEMTEEQQGRVISALKQILG